MVSYNPIYSDLHLLKGFNCGMIELLQGFSMAKGLVFGHSQKKRDKPINPKPVLIDNNADINQNIRSIFPCPQNCQVYSGCLIGPIMTNCLHQVMLPKKPFVRPFQKSSTIIDLPFATTAFANSVASVCDDDMSKFSIKHSKYGGLFWSHNFPFISIYDVSFDVSPTLNHRN